MAEVTRDDGTGGELVRRQSLGLNVGALDWGGGGDWGEKQKLGKVYALDETSNNRNACECVRAMEMCAEGVRF